jgi:AcrR family transcriptional regulator
MVVTARLSRAERQAQTREELLDAAMRLFTGRGFHATSLDQVAAEAGYTKGAVYSNFRSKEDLFFALYERRVEAVVEQTRAELRRADPIEFAGAVLARRVDDGWLAVFFEFWAHVLRNAELRERFLALHRRAREPLVEATRDWPGDDNERMTVAMFAMVSGLRLEQLTDPSFQAEDLVVHMLTALKKARTEG